MNNHQKSIFHQVGNFLNPDLAFIGLNFVIYAKTS